MTFTMKVIEYVTMQKMSFTLYPINVVSLPQGNVIVKLSIDIFYVNFCSNAALKFVIKVMRERERERKYAITIN